MNRRPGKQHQTSRLRPFYFPAFGGLNSAEAWRWHGASGRQSEGRPGPSIGVIPSESLKGAGSGGPILLED